ncbi:hypothetical protein ACS0TY_010981 [Phlomoides rotata]
MLKMNKKIVMVVPLEGGGRERVGEREEIWFLLSFFSLREDSRSDCKKRRIDFGVKIDGGYYKMKNYNSHVITIVSSQWLRRVQDVPLLFFEHTQLNLLSFLALS